MIVVDTSALTAIVLGEPRARHCLDVMIGEDELLISAGTLSEVLIVALGKNIEEAMAALIARLAFDVVPVTEVFAAKVGMAYARWGKGIHPARLNFGDCFAYALAQERSCPLLYIGDDFTKTDVQSIF